VTYSCEVYFGDECLYEQWHTFMQSYKVVPFCQDWVYYLRMFMSWPSEHLFETSEQRLTAARVLSQCSMRPGLCECNTLFPNVIYKFLCILALKFLEEKC